MIEVGIGIVLREGSGGPSTDGGSGSPAYEILITKRKQDTVFGGYWELPGGKADPGESPEACVARELSEEVGVAVEVVARLNEVVHVYPHGTVRLHPRLCRLTAESPEPRNLHVAEHRWCAIGELHRFEFPPANDSIMRELVQRLRTGL